MEDVRPRRHDGVELVYVLEGAPGFYLREAERTPASGDAASLDATVPHGCRRVSREPCRALVAVVP